MLLNTKKMWNCFSCSSVDTLDDGCKSCNCPDCHNQATCEESQVKPPPQRKHRKTPIPASLRAAVWNTYIGEERGKCKCPVCNTHDITPFTFHCGHVVAEANGGLTNLENLRPICAQCNTSSKTRDMREFKKTHFGGGSS